MEIGVLVSQLTLADIRQLLLPSTQAIYYSSVRLRKGELNDGRPACLPSFLPSEKSAEGASLEMWLGVTSLRLILSLLGLATEATDGRTAT